MEYKRYEINTFEELKCISDKLRMKISMLLIEKEMTATEIGKKLDIPKAKIFYHLKELEKYNMVKISRSEVKGSNVFKYYVATHKGFKVNPTLLNSYQDEVSSSTKGMITSQIQRTIDVMNDYGLIFNDNQIISKTVQVNWSNKQFEEFNKKIENLIGEIDAQGEDTEKQLHYINIIGFEISDKIFNRKDDV
ncbi:ArsR/SmtB family transcription factor [Staphylococcus equorum]|uniref:ArsR/SmtB family transcription factor n=1 Tax=Staphylococcus equorum TaxID=246432 RepID=UPI001F200828|nr:winged helix-turn-helix domain-containing protein [Staphylococcus equorum]MCE5008024.1 winged helix-turn-helix transcriptional regulator [Staphylococcus equorum]